MRINSLGISPDFRALIINNTDKEQKELLKVINRQMKKEEDVLDTEKLLSAIDATTQERGWNMEIKANMAQGENKTRVKSIDLKLGARNKDGSTGGGRRAKNIAPDNFIKTLKDYARSACVNPDEFKINKIG